MSALDPIIQVNIFRDTAALAKASFGLPLILDTFLTTKTEPVFDRYREYTSLLEMTDDGWIVTDAVYLIAQTIFSQNPKIPKIAVGRHDSVADTNLADGLGKIQAVNDQWYGLIATTVAEAEILIIAAWVEANGKLYGALSNDADIIDIADETDIASQLKALSYNRTFLNYHKVAEKRLDAGIIGKMFPDTPGRATWCYKNISGVPTYKISSGEKTATLEKKANVYTEIVGRGRYEQGTVAVGEYIDIIWGTDYLKSEIQSEVFKLIGDATDKIPLNDGGISSAVGIVRGVLNRFAGDSFKLLNADSIVVSAPLAADIPIGDKATRTLPDLEWEATYQGAMHFVKMRGVISL